MTGCCTRSWKQRRTPDPKRTPLEQKYGDFYAACMNTELADKKGVAPLQPTLDTINSFSDKKQLAAVLGTLEIKDGISGLFDFGVGQDQKDSTSRSRKPAREVSGCPIAITTCSRTRGSRRFARNTSPT